MLIKKVSLFNFKNHTQTDIDFVASINCFTGKNGSGKTNLLDAIHYLALTKSSVNGADSLSIKHNEVFFSIKGEFDKEGSEYELICALQQGQKKTFKVNGNEYNKLSEHIGEFPLVLIAPNDTDIIRDSSEIRRKFFDGVISQLDHEYLHYLIRYNHFLKQRNALLKQLDTIQNPDDDLLEPYNKELIQLGSAIGLKRQTFINRFLPIFQNHYKNLANDNEKVTINYLSKAINKNFNEIFRKSMDRDLVLQRTNVGIHKDEFEFLIEGNSVKKLGSQGQQKSFIIALKLAQFDILKEEKGFKPILLLDDIFDKLDDFRIKKLIEMVAQDSFGQLFITDARPERSRHLLEGIDKELQFFEVSNGEIVL